MRPLRLAGLLSVALFCATVSVRAASDWQIIKVGHWDYLSVENIAKFYGFPADVTPVEKTVRLDNGRNQLEVTLGSREAIVNGVRNWLCFPVAETVDGKYLVSRIDLAKTIEPQFRPHLARNLRTLKTVVIDAGHGGVEKGAASSYGNEKDFTLDVARRLKPLLEAKGLQVIMTRQSDELVPLPERARIANATKDSIFVSIHFNATDRNSAATGFEIYSLTPRGAPSTQDNSLQARFANMQAGSPADAASLILSTSVYHAMLGYMPEFDRGVKRARFAVLRLTRIPAILVEGGFLTERQESRLIAQPEWRKKLAEAISVGIGSYKTLIETKQRPLLLADYRRQFDGVLVARDGNAPAATEGTPPVFAASNQQAGLAAQITEAIHREPSPQMAVGESEQEEDEPPTTVAAASVSAAVSDAPPIAVSDVPLMEAAAPAADMPTPAETHESTSAASLVGPPAFIRPIEPVALAAPQPISTATPAPKVVRKYWVLKFDAPPKFRQ
ncbi:MAG TPA: N-acetylmuramoyl-L-alanine amidase [Chthoniobacterales bacterium]|nr:N-acetylmuramoyl-L-alanine amidase [Chthoniobacterales bacterium]